MGTATSTRSCSYCGSLITTGRNSKKFCTQDCYNRSKDRTVTLTCEICEGQFTKPYRHRSAKTCSRECFLKLNGIRKRTSVKKQCEACGTRFDVNLSSKDQTRFCSYDCYLSTCKTRLPPVEKICECCEKKFTVTAGKAEGRRFCSKSCSSSGENNAMFGMPGSMTGRPAWSRGLTKETDPRVRKMGEKISVVIADKLVNGEWKHIGFKGELYSSPKNGNMEVYLRSSYESRYARALDNSSDVVSWEHEPFRIPYLLEGSIHNYVPDFLVVRANGSRVLVEVKPKTLSDTKVMRAKTAAAEGWCAMNGVVLQIVSEEELDSL